MRARNGARSRSTNGGAATTSSRQAARVSKDTVARALPYYCQNILPAVLGGKRVLVAAHGNSLRALVMVLDRLTPETIPTMELATGVPLVYRLNADSTVASKEILTA